MVSIYISLLLCLFTNNSSYVLGIGSESACAREKFTDTSLFSSWKHSHNKKPYTPSKRIILVSILGTLTETAKPFMKAKIIMKKAPMAVKKVLMIVSKPIFSKLRAIQYDLSLLLISPFICVIIFYFFFPVCILHNRVCNTRKLHEFHWCGHKNSIILKGLIYLIF